MVAYPEATHIYTTPPSSAVRPVQVRVHPVLPVVAAVGVRAAEQVHGDENDDDYDDGFHVRQPASP